MSKKYITIKGCRVHNLKNVSIKIPRNKLVVITGLSGSGKSSLAFDTIYAEGQRRYMESLSSYAKQFLDILDKPDVDLIDGLSPVIAIDQKANITNPRSTIGTITEIYDLLRLLYSKVGIPHCPKCKQIVQKQTPEQITEQIFKDLIGKKVFILTPIKPNKKYKHLISNIIKANFFHIRIDNKIYDIDNLKNLKLDNSIEHKIEVVVDSFRVENTNKMKKRLKQEIEKALDLGNGIVTIYAKNFKQKTFYEKLYCHKCKIELPNIEIRSFSFNNPYGACESCSGLGTKQEINPELLIPNKNLTIEQGAVRVWAKLFTNQPIYNELLKQVSKKNKIPLNVEIKNLNKKQLKTLLYGDNNLYKIKNKEFQFKGIVDILETKYKETDSDYVRREISQYMTELTCKVCKGKRLKPEFLAVTINDLSITDLTLLSLDELSNILKNEILSIKDSKKQKIAAPIIKEIQRRIENLINVGLDYLTLNRSAITLSGGEAQRIRLAKQLSSNLSEVIYVLDEPSIGLHPSDTEKLIKTLKKLRDLDNTVIVVEHDEEIIKNADFIIDIGPGAGIYGGRIIAKGTLNQILKNKKSTTAKYLLKQEKVFHRTNRRKINSNKIIIKGASAFNLKNIDVEIPLNVFTCVTGVSGSGKSTLIIDILSNYLNKKFYRSKQLPAKHKQILGVEKIDKVITIDQSPIGRTPRSNPATYTGVFTYIRELFANQQEAKLYGLDASHFSFNVKGGRCESCSGDGLVKIEMQFMPDVYIECSECKGKRYKNQILEIYYKQKNISDILDMTVCEALEFFSQHTNIKNKLQALQDVGLGYIKLGQSATTLSGGEAQRVKLATELSRKSTGKTLYILDEPTTGLHFEDIKKLLTILHKLVDKGNSVLVIEHNLDVINSADWIIDLGPEGGKKGGQIVAYGPPEKIMQNKNSKTGIFLKKMLNIK